MLEFPELLDFPDKLMCLLDSSIINSKRYIVLDGGRGSGKTQSIARLILYLAEKHTLRIVGAREQQNSIEDSVYAVFRDLILKYDLNFDIKKSRITHKESGSEIFFKGMREQGAVNIKGLENVDIVFFDEGQQVSQSTLNILLPTIRKNKAKLFFALNRYVRNDPVMQLVGREDTLHIHIDYFENKHCTEALKNEARECKERNIKDYNHVWLGQPLTTTSDYLFNFDKLAKAALVKSHGEPIKMQSVMSVDLSSGGGDLCCATHVKRISNTTWDLAEEVCWEDPDTDVSTGKIVEMYGDWRPDILIVDASGAGYPVFVTLSKTIGNIIGFLGGSNDKCEDPTCLNNRYQAYLDLKYLTDQEWIRITSQYMIKDLETIKKVYSASGKIRLKTKQEQRKEGVDSQDRGDSLSMAAFAIKHFLGKVNFQELDRPQGMRTLKRITGRKKR